MIPLSVPSVQGNEWKYIKECLDTEWVSTAGKYVSIFEDNIAEYSGADYAVACMNGTAALQVALRLVGVEPDDEVIVPSLTFISPVNVIRYLGAEPVFMDSDDFYNIDIIKTIQFIKEETEFKNGFTFNKTTGKRISAIIPVHIFGNAVDIFPLIDICRERNIKIVEDASESLGAKYNIKYAIQGHTGTIGDIGCFSFNGNKIITTGGGGMIVTNNKEYAEKAKYLTTQAKDDPVRYIHNEIGYNFRMTNIQAAMGVAQLEMLPSYLKAKEENYNLYKKEIDKIPGFHLAEVPGYAKSNYWFYCLQIDNEVYDKGREELMAYLQEKGIQTRPVWYPNHLQKPYKENQSYRIEKALDLCDKTLNLPCSVGLKKEEVDKIIEAIRNE